MSKLSILDPSGHTELLWRTEDEPATQAARRTFEDLIESERFVAFDLTEEPATIIKEFRIDAEEILVVPQFAGG